MKELKTSLWVALDRSRVSCKKSELERIGTKLAQRTASQLQLSRQAGAQEGKMMGLVFYVPRVWHWERESKR